MIEPIYICRPVSAMTSAALADVALSIGLTELVTDMHVTIAYSTTPVDWDEFAFIPDLKPLSIDGGERAIRAFDGGAVVMEIESRALTQRWSQMIMAGASWDFPEYRPHITLGYAEGFQVRDDMPAYQGMIQLEAERREWLNTEA